MRLKVAEIGITTLERARVTCNRLMEGERYG